MSSRLLEVILDGKAEPDGQAPDWVCIYDEVAQGNDHSMIQEPEEVETDAQQDISLLGTAILNTTMNTMNTTLTSEARIPQVKEMAVVGKPLNIKMERKFE